MADNIDPAKLKELLERVGLLDPGFSGTVKVTAKTPGGTESVTIKV